MPQSGRNSVNRFLTLSLAALVCLLSGRQTASAAGCHAPGRPAIDHALSWDDFARVAPRFEDSPLAHSGPAILPPHCPGETPTLPSATALSTASQSQPAPRVEPPSHGEFLAPRSSRSRPLPLASRLDRPPRGARRLTSSN